MKINETILANGLRIVTAQMRESRSVAVNIAVATGSRFEDFHVNGGVSHFLEHLLFKGTDKYPTPESISQAVDEVGGYTNAYTAEDITNYFVRVPARHTELALDVLADMVKAPLLESKEINRERTVVIEEMHMWQDDPMRYISTLYPELLFPDNPLGLTTFGPEEVIRTVPRRTITAYLKTHYQPNNLVVAAAGRVEHDIFVAQVEALLGDLEPGELPGVQTVGRDSSDQLVATHKKETAQTHFVIVARGFPYHHADAMALRVMAAILGLGSSSRLFMEIREKRGLAYHVSTDVSSFVDTGIFEVYTGAMLDKADEAMQAVLKELERIRRKPVGERELAKAKEQLRASLEFSQESTTAVADRLSRQLAVEGELKSVDETVKEILEVSVEDVQRVAKTVLDPAQLRAAIIAPDPRPLTKLFKQLVKPQGGK